MDLVTLFGPAFLNGAGVITVVLFVGVLIMRGNLVPGAVHKEALANAHIQVARAEERADRWESVALRALDATERLTEPVVVATKVLSRLPNPSREGAEDG